MNGLCKICKVRPYEQGHHLFPQTKLNRKLYPDFINDERNKIMLCSICHLNKSVPHYTEKEFCEIMGIEPRSKSGKNYFRTGSHIFNMNNEIQIAINAKKGRSEADIIKAWNSAIERLGEDSAREIWIEAQKILDKE
jgi:hypothetical protein